MATDRRYKKFTYKKAICAHGAETLQAKLTSALNLKNKHASERCQQMDNDGKSLRGVEQIITQNKMLFGTIIDVNPGTSQPTVGADLSEPTLKITLTAPPKKSEYLEKYLFFGVKDNHVAVIQSTIRSRQLQEYFNWLLQSVTPGDAAYHPTSLVDLPPTDVRAVKIERVKSIELKQTMQISGMEKQKALPAGSKRMVLLEDKKHKSLVPISGSGLIRDIIRQFAPDKEKLLDSMSFNDALLAGRVRATVLLEVQGRMKENDAVPFMDEFAATLSHDDDDDLDYVIHVEDGPDITPATVKFRESILLNCDDGMPLVSEVRTEMANWLASAIKAGRVY
jgi:hypothetical protein